MRVAVITPYHMEDIETLRQCQASVAAQTYPCSHFMVADGFPKPEVEAWPVQHVVLPNAHGIGGDLPRCVGSILALKQGFDAITYLDADNWYVPDHIELLVTLQRASIADVCIALRSMHRVDGTAMPLADPPSHDRYYDTSCILLTRPAFPVVFVWAMIPPQAGVIDDRIVSLAIRKHRFRIAKTDRPTVAYRTA